LRVEVYEIISPLITTLSVSHSVDAVVDSDLLSNRKLSIAVDTNVQNAGSDNKEVFSLHKGRSLYLKLQIRSNCMGAWSDSTIGKYSICPTEGRSDLSIKK